MGIKRMPRVSSSSRLSSEHGFSGGMGGLRRGLTEPTSLNLLDGGSADPIRDCIRTLTPSTSLSQLQNLTATVVRRAGHGPGAHRTAERHAYDTPGQQQQQQQQAYQHDEAAVMHRAALARKAFTRHNIRRNNSSLTRLNELAAPVAQSVVKGVRSVQRLGRGRKDFFKSELRGFMGARLVIFFPILIMVLYASCSVAAVAVPFFVGGLGLYPSGGLVGSLGTLGSTLGFGGPARPAVTYEYGKNPLVLAMTSSASKLEGLKLHGGQGGKGKVKDADMDAALFLDAVEEVKPVYESLGFMFSIASREVTNNVDKLRKHVQQYGPERRPTLHDLVESDIAAGRQWHKDGSFEALRWLGFGLKFMETVFTCVGEGESDPSVCAQLAYDRALKPVHGPALQHLSKSLLRIVPVSPGMIIEKLEVDDEQARAYMVRWGRAILRPRAAIEEWYTQWPPPKA